MARVIRTSAIPLLLLCSIASSAFAEAPGVWILESRQSWLPSDPEHQGKSCRLEGDAQDRGATFRQTCTSSITNVTTIRAAHAGWELPADLTRLVPGTNFPAACVVENMGDTSSVLCEAHVGAAGYVSGQPADPGGAARFQGVATIPKPGYDRNGKPNPLTLTFALVSTGGGGGAQVKRYLTYRWSTVSQPPVTVANPPVASPPSAATPTPTPAPTGEGVRPGSPAGTSPMPPPAPRTPQFPLQSVRIFDNMNPEGCGTTDVAAFSLTETTRIDKVGLWFNWSAGLESVAYEISGPGGTVVKGVLVKSGCDPYQASWCAADAEPRSVLAPGRYQVRTSIAGICQNPTSQGNGFLHIDGAVARSGR